MGGAIIDDTIFLDTLLHADAAPCQFCNKARRIEGGFWREHTSTMSLPMSEQLRAYGGWNAGHLRSGLPSPLTHTGMTCTVNAVGLASRPGAFHLDVQQDSPVANITRVPLGLLLQQVGAQKLPGMQRRAVDTHRFTGH